MRRGRLVAGAALVVVSVIAPRFLSVPVAPLHLTGSASQVVPFAAPAAPIAAPSRAPATLRARHGAGADLERFVASGSGEEGAVRERLDIGEAERWRDPDLGRIGTLRTTVSSRRSDQLAVGGNTQVINPVYDGLQAEAAIAMSSEGDAVLVAGFNDASGFALTPYNVSGVARSLDGGLTWTTSGPLPTGGYSLNGDPDVKYDPVGNRFFYSSVAAAPGKTVICVHRSDAQGDNWDGPFVIPSSDVAGKFSDKEMIDVHPITGRLLAAWVDVNGGAIRASYSDDGGMTWSAGSLVAQSVQTVLQSPQVRFGPGLTNETSRVWLVCQQLANSGRLSLLWVSSDDGGDTWGTPQLLHPEVPKPDQVLGLGRTHMIPAIDVDPELGRLYVVDAVPDTNGMTDIEFFASPHSPSFSAPIRINSNPGADGAQFRPTVAVDRFNHRIHVTWYDQPGGPTGDLTELMRSFSDDLGATWSPPTPVFDRPFRASFGDPGGPNLGDYNECVAGGGVLHAVAAATVAKPRFDDGQPNPSMGAIETYHARLENGPTEVALRIGAVALSDACSPLGSARLDVGEVGYLHFTLFNYVANPVCSPAPYTNVTATLSSPTPGVTLAYATQWFGTIIPLGSGTNTSPFHIQLDPGFAPGTDVDLVLDVTSDQGLARFRWSLPTGSPGATVTLIDEDFEGVSMPDLPAGWSNHSEYPYTAWKTEGVTAGVGSGSPAAFHGEEFLGSDRLFSPSVTVPAALPGVESWVTLEFDLAYSLRNVPPRLVEAMNYCRLRVHDLTGGPWTERSLDVDAFAEEFTTGARHGYDHRHPGNSSSPQVNGWSGGSQGVQRVRIRIPGEGITGHTIQLRFDFFDEAFETCEDAGLPGPCGVSIDNVVLRYVLATSSPCPAVGVPSAVSVAFGLRGVTPNPSNSGRLAVRFALADAGEARLEMFDATGRVARAIDLSGFGPGEHSIDLASRGQIAPGIYFVRLRQAGHEAVSRAVVLR